MLQEHCRRMEAVLIAQGTAAGIFDHPNNIGGAREVFVKNFLSLNIPPKYRIWDGEMIDHTVTPNDKTGRKQVDVAIARDDVFVFRTAEGSALMPCEAVLATLEVKSDLNKQHLLVALDAIQSFGKLQRTNPGGISSGSLLLPNKIFNYIFGFNGMTLLTLQQHMEEYSRSKPADICSLFDLCIVLRRFVVFNRSMFPYLGYNGPDANYVWFEQEKDNLFFLLASLVQSCCSFIAVPPDLSRYMGWSIQPRTQGGF